VANNFKILVHRDGSSLHLKLKGDFDGGSAHELLNVLKSRMGGASRIFIHTSCLNQVHAFGQNVLHSNLDLIDGRAICFIFTGEKASQLAPVNHGFIKIAS
jgi:hypothetical protein